MFKSRNRSWTLNLCVAVLCCDYGRLLTAFFVLLISCRKNNVDMIHVNPKLIFFILMTSSLACGYCPRERIHSIRLCMFRFFCIDNVLGAQLPGECKGSVNHPVSVDLTIYNALDRYDNHSNPEFTKAVTSFKAIAVWPETSLSLLKHMPRLKLLILTQNHMAKIRGSPFFTLKHLQHLDLSNNYLSDIHSLFKFEKQPNKLVILNLANNTIKEISNDTFSELTNLKELDLSGNQISDLTEEPFQSLTNLEVLRINNNRITNLNGAVNELDNLRHLYLRGNQIEKIDEQSLKDLETFDVSGNQLEKLRPIIFLRHWHHGHDESGTIEYRKYRIILSDNHLRSVPNGTSKEIAARFTRQSGNKVEIVTEVDLSKNYITNIEYNAFQSIMNMNSLDLSHNMLAIFLVNPENLTHVKFLNLSSNLITNLYFESFSSMTSLQNLDLSNNSLCYIPEQTFTHNYNLKSVNMTYNEIKNLKNLHINMFHIDGGVLDLSHNGLSRLSILIGEALRLVILTLNHNDIVNAAAINLVHQNELKKLEMKNNHITELNTNSLRLPLNLVDLDLSENDIAKIAPSAFHNVRHLKSLYLGHNNVTKIEYGAFQGLTELVNLDLSFNNIRSLDSKLLMDLKSLTVLSLRSNGLYYLEYKAWLGHKLDLKVYLDNNDISCEWLSQALRDHNNGYSKMRPTVLQFRNAYLENSLEGIPCKMESENIMDPAAMPGIADERLLVINQKILEAVNEQTNYLRSFMRQFSFDTSRVRLLDKGKQ